MQVMGMQEMILIVLVMLSGGSPLGLAKLLFFGFGMFFAKAI
jgi:hypothetical protein